MEIFLDQLDAPFFTKGSFVFTNINKLYIIQLKGKINCFPFKNISSSTPHKNIRTQLILLKNSTNTNIMKTQIYKKDKVWPQRSHKDTSMLWRGGVSFNFQIFWSYYNLTLRSLRQLLKYFITYLTKSRTKEYV